MAKKEIDFDMVRELALALTDVEESTIHGSPSFKVGRKLLACPAIHSSSEPNSLAVRISVHERAVLIASKPGVYYVTDHYEGCSMVLVRLSAIDKDALRDLLDKAWHSATSKSGV
jgi:hypothetical protein